MWKTRQKGLRVLDFALLLVFKWYHGSEWVKAGWKNKNDLPLAVFVYLFYFLSIESAETIEEGKKQGEETEIEATSEQNGKIFMTDTALWLICFVIWVRLCPWERYWSKMCMHAYTHSHKRETLITNLGSLQRCFHTITEFRWQNGWENGAWLKMFCFYKRDFHSSLRTTEGIWMKYCKDLAVI